MKNIYLITTENEKFYIGSTSNDIDKRLEEHKYSNTKGAIWLRKHKPIAITLLERTINPYCELQHTLDMMDKYGIDNVRGAEYCQLDLDVYQQSAIIRSIRHAQDRCMRCGWSNHKIAGCYASKSGDIHPLIDKKTNLIKPECIFSKQLVEPLLPTREFNTRQDEMIDKEIIYEWQEGYLYRGVTEVRNNISNCVVRYLNCSSLLGKLLR